MWLPARAAAGNVHGMPDARSDNLGVQHVLIQNLNQVLQQRHPIITDIIHPPYKGANITGPARRPVWPGCMKISGWRWYTPSLRRLDIALAVLSEGDLDHYIGMYGSQQPCFPHHTLIIHSDDLGANRSLHQIADFADELVVVASFPGNQGWIGSDPIQKTQGVIFHGFRQYWLNQ